MAVVVLSEGERFQEHVLSDWKEGDTASASVAAQRFGWLSDTFIVYSHCWRVFEFNLTAKKVPEDRWGDVKSHFHQSRDTLNKDEVAAYFHSIAANDNEPAPVPLDAPTPLSELTSPGGVVGDLVDWIVSSSSRPSRELALAAVLPFVGALLGRRFASPTDLRTNFYTVGLAGSGFGKDHARAQLKLLAAEAQLDRFIGPSRFMSASALRGVVMAKPACFCMVDEFGGMMRQINDKKAGIHNQLIRSDLLEMFTSARTTFEGAAYASNSTPDRIHNPNLCLYGTSTPEDFWASVSSLNTSDGLLPRFLLFNVTGSKPDRVEAQRSVGDVPKPLIEACQSLALAGRGSGNLSAIDNGAGRCKATPVPYSEGARAELERFEALVDEREAIVAPQSLPILNRAVEHAIKLALTASVATEHRKPVISGDAMVWATKLAWHSTATMIEETRGRIADNQREADRNRIFEHISKAGKDGITEGKIGDRCASIERNRRADILKDLLDADRVERREIKTGARSRIRYYAV
jgi:hypothetical protein